ncbi:MAG: UDP-N-acetylglucosamine--N-acetylmuramyl-(pentapeptide) pyrophosphoryl-undecaprenol N-acetylglucosamine transferase [Bdellovibrionales bacterium]|nr:UDP-N-acetylglucosamine--N-acetylmuramyl-(pentapeptide) pyrophosphoryl-undecaprenol N-acetylglucosamine transferase [Bdellovibrionales bacterium]
MSVPSRRPSLIVAGGGSAGHIHAGFAIAHEWKRKFGPESSVTFICSRGPIELKVLPREKFSYVMISLGSLNRAGLLQKVKTLLQLPGAFLLSLRVILRERPTAVIGVGGYASGPPVLLAGMFGWLLGARAALLEQNAVPGLTNRLLKPFVHLVFGVFDTLSAFFGRERVVVSGNPIRAVFDRMPSAAAALDGRAPFRIFIFGGSQGAVGMNSLVMEALKELRLLYDRLSIVHQTGELDFARISAAHAELGTGARVEKFIFDMAGEYCQACLVISRAGMSTLSELAAVGRASVLVPLPTAADNHQEKNARVYEAAGAAWVVPQGSPPSELASLIEGLVASPAAIIQREQKVVAFHRPDAAKRIVARLAGEV